MSIIYDSISRSWKVGKQKTDYRTDYKTDYETTRRTDNATDLKTDYPTNLPTDLPTNLKYDYPTTLRTNFPTDQKFNLNYYGKNISFVPKVGDSYTYKRAYRVPNPKFGSGYSTRYVDVTIDGVKATLLRELVSSGINIDNALRIMNENLDGVRSVRDSNLENDRVNNENKRANEENARLNTDNYNKNLANLKQNIKNQEINNRWREYNEKNRFYNETNQKLNIENAKLNAQATELNKKNSELNAENQLLNKKNTGINSLYDTTLRIASSTRGGDYVDSRNKIDTKILIDSGFSLEEANTIIDDVRDQFKEFYREEKLERWDTSLGATPPYGIFDPDYYRDQNPTVEEAYRRAEEIDDIDITERYGEKGFYLQHYTNIGKPTGLRGNKEEDTAAANKYVEEKLTDKEIQDIRDYQLGVDKETLTERILSIPEVATAWTKARMGDPYWSELAKEKYLDPSDPEEFAVLFRLSERPEDIEILAKSITGRAGGITQIEDAINEVLGSKAELDTKKFGALTQTVLKDTIDQMKKVRGEQEMLSFYRGFSGFTEVVDINKELKNSILGDTGVGGILSFTSGGKAEESLLGALQNVTGMRNNVTYNWQKWFNEEIKNKYGIDYEIFEPLEEKKDIIQAFTSGAIKDNPFDKKTGTFNEDFLKLAGYESTESLVSFLERQGEEGALILETIKGDIGEEADKVLRPIEARLTADIKILDEGRDRGIAVSYEIDDATEMMNIEAEFARNYIDEYLIPRFNTSRSMDEFIEYLDVRQEEQNPFQTQDGYSAMKDLSDLYTKEYLDKIKLEGPRSFDPNFYFDPTGDVSRSDLYAKQKETVEADWEKAKAGDEYWKTQAYRFGVDIENKAAFARMHFEVKGQGEGFDAAEDIVNAGKVKDFIYGTVLPVLKEESLKIDPVFGEFITPEEFADELLRGVDPYETPDEWKEILQRYGLESFAGTLDELKEYIIETLRTGSATTIREQIKYLNEKRQKPTQEILGVTYIERPEDYKDEMAKPTTELYSVFQKAGYAGTEDEFYDNFFPDLDRSEQVLLTKAGRDDALKTYGLDLGDPFSSLGTIESFFPEDLLLDEEGVEKDEESYFKLGEDDDDSTVTSAAGKEFLGEFTSMFKGL